MWTNTRMLTRAILLIVVSAGLYIPLMAGNLLIRKSTDLREAWQARMLQIWSKAVCIIIGLRADIIGKPPPGTGLFVSNHLSYVDIVLIASQMPVAFVAKREISNWPVVGHLTRMTGTVFVDRRRHRSLVGANDVINERLSAGRPVVLFAEGTSTEGETVEPFRPSLLKIASDFGHPVNYGFLAYQITDDEAGRQLTRDRVCWYGDDEFFNHIVNLLRLKGFRARLVFGDSPVVAHERKSLANQLHKAVLQQASKYSWS